MFSIFKIPHPWWHFFFTKVLREDFRGGPRWIDFYCSRCDTVHQLKFDEVGRVIEQKTRVVFK
jgi:hypothetical protein